MKAIILAISILYVVISLLKFNVLALEWKAGILIELKIFLHHLVVIGYLLLSVA